MAGVVLVGSLCGGATWLERETLAGAIVRTVAVGPAPLSVVVDERSGHAFVLSRSMDSPDAASVSMVDTATAALLRTQAIGRLPQALTVDDRDAHVLVANGDNTVRVLDAQNGAVPSPATPCCTLLYPNSEQLPEQVAVRAGRCADRPGAGRHRWERP